MDAELVFDDRPYELGEVVDLMVELRARGDVEVREGHVDLVCEMRWTQMYDVEVPAYRPMPSRRGSISESIPMVRRRGTEQRRENYVHKRVVFLQDTRLSSGTTQSYSARLEIPSELTPGEAEPIVRWRLVAAVDVARARDITKKQTIVVTLG